jgi:Protein of unknown function (DUF4230)
MQSTPAPPRVPDDVYIGPPKRPTGAILVALLLGILVAFLYLALPSRNSALGLGSRFWSVVTGRSIRFDVSQPTVVARIQKLQRLETVQYTMDKVITGTRESRIFPDFLAGDRLLMMVHGEAVGGIDFATLKPGDVFTRGKLVHLHLPAAQIFSARLDNSRTRVYSRQTGLLVPVDPNLETEVRQEAERQLQQSALIDGILDTAQQNARTTLTGMLTGLGFEKVEFD